MSEVDRQAAIENLDNIEIHVGMIRQYLDPIEQYLKQARKELQCPEVRSASYAEVPCHVSDE